MFKKDIMDKDNYMRSCLINCKYRIDTYIIQTENQIQCGRVDPMHVWPYKVNTPKLSHTPRTNNFG